MLWNWDCSGEAKVSHGKGQYLCLPRTPTWWDPDILPLLSDVDWQLPLTEVVEPVDFEEYVSSHAPGVEPGPLRELMEFPQDDMELLPLDKECITLEPPLPDEDEWVFPL